MFGIKNLKEALLFFFSLGDAIKASLEDGEFTIMDTFLFFGVLSSAAEAFEDIDQLKNEILDLDEAEKEELDTFLRDNFDIENEDTEALIEDIATEVLNIFLLVKKYVPSKEEPSE